MSGQQGAGWFIYATGKDTDRLGWKFTSKTSSDRLHIFRNKKGVRQVKGTQGMGLKRRLLRQSCCSFMTLLKKKQKNKQGTIVYSKINKGWNQSQGAARKTWSTQQHKQSGRNWNKKWRLIGDCDVGWETGGGWWEDWTGMWMGGVVSWWGKLWGHLVDG